MAFSHFHGVAVNNSGLIIKIYEILFLLLSVKQYDLFQISEMANLKCFVCLQAKWINLNQML